MSDTNPKIAGYQGTLSGGPVLIDIQKDHGFVADFLVVIPATGTGLTMSVGTSFSLQIPTGVLITLPGPFAEFTLTQVGMTAVNYILYASSGVGQLPALQVAVSGGGGGGGSAPDDAKYLINDTTVPGTLTNAVPVAFNPGTLLVGKDSSGDFAGGSSHALDTLANFGGGVTVTTGGGTGTTWTVLDSTGSATYGALEFLLLAGGAHTAAYVKGKTGEGIATFKPAIPGQINGLSFPDTAGGTARGVNADGAQNLHLSSTSGQVHVDLGANTVAKFTNAGLELDFPLGTQQLTFAQSALIQCGLFGDLELNGSAGAQSLKFNFGVLGTVLKDPSKVTIHIDGMTPTDWVFKDTGELHGPGLSTAQIKNLADATTDDAAATWGQAKANAVTTTDVRAGYGNVVFGGQATGTIAANWHLLVGGGWATAVGQSQALTIWRAPAACNFRAGRLYASTPPIVGGADTVQTFTLIVNGAPTSLTCTLLGDHRDQVDCTVASAAAGDTLHMFIGATDYTYVVGLTDTDIDVASAFVALAAADPDYTPTNVGGTSPVITLLAVVAGTAGVEVISTTSSGTTSFTNAVIVPGANGTSDATFTGAAVPVTAGQDVQLLSTTGADGLDVGALNVMVTLEYTNA